MHPYMIEKLAASGRDDFLVAAERHRRLVQARRNQAAIRISGTPAMATIRAAVSRSLHAAKHGLKHQADELACAVRQRRSRRNRRPIARREWSSRSPYETQSYFVNNNSNGVIRDNDFNFASRTEPCSRRSDDADSRCWTNEECNRGQDGSIDRGRRPA